MNRSSLASLPDSRYGECSCRSKARRRLSRGMGAPLGEGQRPSPRDMRSISGTDTKGGKDRYTILAHRCLQQLELYWETYRPTHYPFLPVHLKIYLQIYLTFTILLLSIL